MTLRPPSLPPVPEMTVAAVQAAFPTGPLSVERRAEFGPLYADHLFADLSPLSGRPVEVAPWRVALVVVRQSLDGFTDRQAADAVRRYLAWKYTLRLELSDPGFDFTLVHDFRQRLLAHEVGQRFRESLPGRRQSPRLDQGAGHAPDRFHAWPGGDPHAPPVGMSPGSPA